METTSSNLRPVTMSCIIPPPHLPHLRNTSSGVPVCRPLGPLPTLVLQLVTLCHTLGPLPTLVLQPSSWKSTTVWSALKQSADPHGQL